MEVDNSSKSNTASASKTEAKSEEDQDFSKVLLF